MRHRVNLLYGRFAGGKRPTRYDDADTQKPASNHWSSSENSAQNAWNVNFNSSNVNNNNKYNSNSVRPVVAYDNLQQLTQSIEDAYIDCLRHKRTSKQAVEYMSVAHADLPILAKELYERKYEIGTSTCFMVKYPKYREVFAAAFRDRIVHHWITQRLNPIFEAKHYKLGNVSHNCRKGFGSLYSIHSVSDAIKRITCNYKKKAYIYKGDLDSFYMRISQPLLWEKIEPAIDSEYHGEDKELLRWVTRMVIFHRPERNCVLNSFPEVWEHLKASKSMFRTEEDRGAPIGNITTQIFVNYFMTDMDEKALKLFEGLNFYYARFVDDFIIICDNKEELLKRVKLLEDFIEKKLSLKVHKDKKYCQEASHGVKYVGAVIKNGRTYLSSRTLARFKERIEGFSKLLMEKKDITILDLQRIESVLNSYLGFCKWHRTYRKRYEYINTMPMEFWQYFYVKGHYNSVHIKKRFLTPKIA